MVNNVATERSMNVDNSIDGLVNSKLSKTSSTILSESGILSAESSKEQLDIVFHLVSSDVQLIDDFSVLISIVFFFFLAKSRRKTPY